MTKLILSSAGGSVTRWRPEYVKSEQASLNITEVNPQQCRVSSEQWPHGSLIVIAHCGLLALRGETGLSRGMTRWGREMGISSMGTGSLVPHIK